jgi:transposase
VGFIEGQDRAQVSLLPPSIDDYITTESLVRVVDAFVDSLDLSELGFERTVAAPIGRPASVRPICCASIYGAAWSRRVVG